MSTQRLLRLFSAAGPEGVPLRKGPRKVLPVEREMRPRRLVAGVALDAGSVAALRRAHALSRDMSVELKVVHVVTPTKPAGRESPKAVGDLAARRARARLAKVAVREWARAEAGIDVPARAIDLRFGEPAEQLSMAARQSGAELLVVGGHAGNGSVMRDELTEKLLARSSCPVLLAGSFAERGRATAATVAKTPTVPDVG